MTATIVIPDKKESKEDDNKRRKLHYKVNDIPKWNISLFFGFQQTTICLSSMLVLPYLVSDLVCAGDATIQLRVLLISATFVVSGMATLLQSTIGIRLSILNGPSFSFIPPLLGFANMPEQRCLYGKNDTVPEELWKDKLQTISGSLSIACLVFIITGATGAVGVFSKLVGPVTTVPLLILLAMSTIPILDEKLSMHWIGIIMVITVIIVAVYLEDIEVPIPRCSRPFQFIRFRLFGQFPYLISVSLVWALCFILTLTGLEPEEGPARTDKAASIKVLRESPWFQVPYPFWFGSPTISLGVMFGFMASCCASIIENLGAYSLAVRVSRQRRMPRSTVNRAVIVEGLGSVLASIFGVCTGVTTYTENVALIHLTKNGSRFTMQIAGLLLIALGLFTKSAAVLASIPDPILGGILCLGMSMIAGVAIGQLQTIDLKMTRNVAIIGFSVLLGMVIPTHFVKNPVNTGNMTMDSILGMLLTIKMLIGGGIGFILDNTVPGASREQRGLKEEHDDGDFDPDDDGYAFPHIVNKFIQSVPVLTKLPFLPSQKNISARMSRVFLTENGMENSSVA